MFLSDLDCSAVGGNFVDWNVAEKAIDWDLGTYAQVVGSGQVTITCAFGESYQINSIETKIGSDQHANACMIHNGNQGHCFNGLEGSRGLQNQQSQSTGEGIKITRTTNLKLYELRVYISSSAAQDLDGIFCNYTFDFDSFVPNSA